jgi:hypothetical protein
MAVQTAAPTTTWRTDRLFYGGMAIAMSGAVVGGFASSFYLRGVVAGPTPPLTGLLWVHGLAFTAWMLLFFTQTVLIASRRVNVHRKLGAVGVTLAAVMIALALSQAVISLRLDHTPVAGISPQAFFVLPFFDMVVFATLVVAAVLNRRRPETHKRLMLMATIALLDAPIARMVPALGPPGFFGIQDLYVIAGPIYDLISRRKINSAYIWGGLLVIASQPIRLLISTTPVWLAFAGWLHG